MKPSWERYCQLVASGKYNYTEAYKKVHGKNVKNPSGKANKLNNKPLVQFRVSELQEEFAVKNGIDADWVRKELIRIVGESKRTGDFANTRGALDMINKMSGNYEKDNQQKGQVNLTMEF